MSIYLFILQLSKYQEQAKEDGVLMRNLVAHQLNMREMVNREAYLARLVKKKQHEEMGKFPLKLIK